MKDTERLFRVPLFLFFASGRDSASGKIFAEREKEKPRRKKREKWEGEGVKAFIGVRVLIRITCV